MAVTTTGQRGRGLYPYAGLRGAATATRNLTSGLLQCHQKKKSTTRLRQKGSAIQYDKTILRYLGQRRTLLRMDYEKSIQTGGWGGCGGQRKTKNLIGRENTILYRVKNGRGPGGIRTQKKTFRLLTHPHHNQVEVRGGAYQ